MTKLTGPLKIFGGKGAFQGKLARWIISLMPSHTHYVEPFFGGGSVLLEKDPEGVSEVVNDIDGELTNFWRVLANPHAFGAFLRFVQAVPFSEPQWKRSHRLGEIGIVAPKETREVAEAIHFFIRCRQSRAGQFKEFATLSKTRTRRGMNEQASAWLSAIEGLPAVHARLKRVVILNRKALEVIRQQDGPKTLFYCDPPYLPEVRASKEVYQHEMDIRDHSFLLHTLSEIEGQFILSGYRSTYYDDVAAENGWHREEFQIPNNAAGGKTKRTMTECLWMNY